LCAVLTNDSTVIVWNLQTFETLIWEEDHPLEVVDFIYLEDKTLVHITNDDDFLQQRHLGSKSVSEAYLEAEGSACRIDRFSEDKIVINTLLEFVQLTSTYQVFNMKTKTLLWRVQGIELLASHFLPLNNHQFLALQCESSKNNIDRYCIWDMTESKSMPIAGASVTNGIYHFGCGVVSNGYLGLQSDKQNVIVVSVNTQEVFFRRTYTNDVCFALW
jgi:WD40 repeat protein